MNEEQLIKIYVPDAEELALKYSFGDLYDLAVERDEEAAAQLEMDCADLPLVFDITVTSLEAVPA